MLGVLGPGQPHYLMLCDLGQMTQPLLSIWKVGRNKNLLTEVAVRNEVRSTATGPCSWQVLSKRGLACYDGSRQDPATLGHSWWAVLG